MTMPTHYRSFRPDLEVMPSGSGGDGRTIYGIAVPYNAPTRINRNLTEQFARGAFNHQLRYPQRVKFAREHMMLGGTLIGAASNLRDDAAGLYVELRAARTEAGDETLELVKDNALDQLSIMFREGQNRTLPGGITERVAADLKEVAVVLEGAYGELATAQGVRSRQDVDYADEAEADAIDAQLRATAEQYLFGGLPALKDHDTERRAVLLGLRF